MYPTLERAASWPKLPDSYGSDPASRRWRRLCLKSFVDVGYEVELYCYDDVEGVPAGVQRCDAAAILPRDQIFQRKSGLGLAVTPSFPTVSGITCSTPRAAGGSTWISPPYD